MKRLSYIAATTAVLLFTLSRLYPVCDAKIDMVRIGYISISEQQADLSQQRAAQCGLGGVELMAEQAEQAGIFVGHKVEIHALPVAGDAGWQDVLLKTVREEKLSALFFAPGTPLPDATLRLALETRGCPFFIATDQNYPTNVFGPFRVVSTNHAMTEALAGYALSQHYRCVTVLMSDEACSKEQAEVFLQCLKDSQISSNTQLSNDQSKYLAIDGELATEAFAVWGDQQFLIQTIRMLRHTGYLGPILASSNCGEPAVINALGIASNNVVFTAQYRVPRSTEEIESEVLSALTDCYVRRYGEYPTSHALFSGYDQMLLFSKAFAIRTERPELTLQQAVSSIQNVKGMAGIFNFNNSGDGIDYPRVYTVESGTVVPVL